ncbi:hypothetical protein Golob_016435 [Gossypium lobatum]|uniref:Bax inhibitor 1-like protein n=1 Tax=Gossypium lobatum TaxID=34289 RepID=A0A7J8M4B1_9ROSI|nr:hypothetical protein [Gossypium lobatum]
MDAFTSFFDSQSRNIWSYDTLKNFRQISPIVQAHLKQVYLTLCCALIASAVGAYLHILWNIGGYLTTFACLGTIIWLLSTPPCEEQKRVSLLMASAVFEGASIGPLIDLAIQIDPSVLVASFVGTALAFACFSGAAMLARRREYLYLGGLLSSGVSIYLGLLVFVGYMIVDTQDTIEKAHLGDLDYVKHALTLFTDFVAVFVRILIIMVIEKFSREEREKEEKERLNHKAIAEELYASNLALET